MRSRSSRRLSCWFRCRVLCRMWRWFRSWIWCRHRRWPTGRVRCRHWCFRNRRSWVWLLLEVIVILVDVRIIMVLSYIALDWILCRFCVCRIHRWYWVIGWRRYIRYIVDRIFCWIWCRFCMSWIRCWIPCWIRCGPMISRIWRGFVSRPLGGKPGGVGRRLCGRAKCRVGSRFGCWSKGWVRGWFNRWCHCWSTCRIQCWSKRWSKCWKLCWFRCRFECRIRGRILRW
mmetsp:Transcript_11811/g.29942  ORF Transcript_11811/g.29942 Transcript_11811/m.29942 type:complete len:229 (+) Transcript_11811:955-1641(+)